MVPAIFVKHVLPPGDDALWLPLIASGLAMLAGSLAAGVLISHPLWLEIRNTIRGRFFNRQESTATQSERQEEW